MTLLDTDAVNRLRDSLERIDYRTDAILEAIGEVGQRGLGRNTTVAAQTSLGSRDDPLAATVRLWLLRCPVPVTQLSALPLDDLVTAGIVAVEDDWARAAIDIRPYDSPDDGAAGWVVSDLAPGLDKVVTVTRPDYVLGVSPASTSLAQMTSRRPVGSALDLGCGCGVQSLHLARHADRVVATDINPRALAMAELSLALSGAETTDGSAVALREGPLYDPVDQRFDLIVSNPPYVMSPPRSDAERLVYREAGFAGDGLVEAVLRGAPGRLNPGGTAQILANWAQIGDQPWQDRLTDWVAGAGCDLWAVEREHLDVHEYIETWLTDAGLDGSAQWRPRYQEWLDYFGELGISGVSMGWLTLTAAGRDTPDLSFEEWPWAIQQPVGVAVGARREGSTTPCSTTRTCWPATGRSVRTWSPSPPAVPVPPTPSTSSTGSGPGCAGRWRSTPCSAGCWEPATGRWHWARSSRRWPGSWRSIRRRPPPRPSARCAPRCARGSSRGPERTLL